MRPRFGPGQLPGQSRGSWKSADVSTFLHVEKAVHEIYQACGWDEDGMAGWMPVGELKISKGRRLLQRGSRAVQRYWKDAEL